MATILIVDDHVLNRELLMMALEDDGHRLLEASDGLQALKLVMTERPDLVITDILMPRMDGYEFVSRLRADAGIAATPVIFYTATYRESEASVMAQSCGVRWTLAKPSDPETIQSTVREALGQPTASHVPTVAAPDEPASRFAGMESQLAASARELKTSTEMLESLMQRGDQSAPEFAELARMVKRLSASTAMLQAMSLRLTTLIEMGIELSGERDPARLIVAGSRLAQNIAVARYAVVGLFGAQPDRLEYFATSGLDTQTEQRLGVPSAPTAGVLGTLLEDRVSHREQGLSGNPADLGLPAEHPPVKSFLGAPIATRERSYGWLYVADKLGADAFSDLDERIVATIADQLAVCYENLVQESEAQETHLKLARELSERIRQGEDLRRFRSAMDAVDDAIFICDQDAGMVVDANPAACVLVGLAREVLLGTSIAADAEGASASELLLQLVDPEGDQQFEATGPDGTGMRLDVRRTSWRGNDGRLLMIIARRQSA